MFLLVQHLGGHRSFPKGQIESGETPLQTAKREVFEETGLSDIDVIPNLYFDHYYSFSDRQGGLINKRVGFFVGEVYDDSIVLQKAELKNYCWKNFQDAMKLLTFDSDKNILKKSYEAIKLVVGRT
ncbi:MAG: NUDIX domain-containing protein [Candidatus Absconditabacteria bacterium]|nr:NUDIX domain-containing protein [Candidatus Absconditabacteria bacterium]